MMNFENILKGGDLRSIGQSNTVVKTVRSQAEFDGLFRLLFHKDKRIVMRAADAIEKITINNPGRLKKHKKEIIDLCCKAQNKELKWHLALIIPRLDFTNTELKTVWQLLSGWVMNKSESKIVRVNALQALSDLQKHKNGSRTELDLVVKSAAAENIASINARIKKLKNE